MNSLSPLWSATSIAIIGATEREGAMGRLPIDYLLRFGYQGKIFPINPKGGNIRGLTAYTNIKDVPTKVELALVMVPANSVKNAVQDCADADVDIAVVMSSGFAESGAEGLQAQNELVDIARAKGMRLVGPNCIGSVGGKDRVLATFSPVFTAASTKVAPGNVALISQSGALGYGTYSLGLEQGLPIGVAVTTGNEADVSALEIAEELSQAKEIDTILLYLEGVDSFQRIKNIAKAKPTAVLKAGRSNAGAAAAASHTGALATADRVIDAALRQAGAIRVNDVEELLDAGAVFAANADATSAQRIAIITTSGGSGILAVDAIESFADKSNISLAQFEVETISKLEQIIPAYGNAQNPVDVTAAVMSQPGMFEECLNVVAADPNVDAIVACFCVLTGNDVEKIASALVGTRNIRSLPLVVARTGAASLAPEGARLLQEAQIPVFSTPERAVRALSMLNERFEVTLRSPLMEQSGGTALPTPTSGDEVELKAMLASVGLPIPESSLATTVNEAIAGVHHVGGRAVFKAVVPGLLHKSDAGGVLLDINEAAATNSFEQLKKLGGNVLVERYVPKGVEVLLGLTGSPLGRVLTLGVGGILTEIVADVAIRVLPVDYKTVEEMINETRLASLLAGARGAAAANRESLIQTVLGIIEATRDWPLESELDINPISVGETAWILDAAYVATGKE